MTPPSVSTQWVYSVGLVVVSARTNKKYHHHQQKFGLTG